MLRSLTLGLPGTNAFGLLDRIQLLAGIGGKNAFWIGADEILIFVAAARHASSRPRLQIGFPRVEIKIADQGHRQLWQLLAVGFGIDGARHPAKQGADFEAGLIDLLDQCAGERAVASAAVQRDLIGLRRIRDHHAARRLDLGQSAVEAEVPAGGRARKPFGQRIVAARIENENLDAARPIQPDHHVVDFVQLEAQTEFVFELGIDRHQIVLSAMLHAMAGVKHQSGVGVLREPREARDGALHPPLGEIALHDDIEADRLQRRRHILGVVDRVGKHLRVLVGRIADHQRDSLLSKRRRCQDHREGGGNRKNPAARQHRHPSPTGQRDSHRD